MKAISGVVDPMGGAMFFDGRDITHSDGVATTKAGIIQVPGGKAVFPTLTVAEHLRAGGWLYRDDPKYLEGAVAEVYRIFPRLDERRDQLAGNLSGGEQQMLALGMAFIAKPKLLMIDELSLGLAPTIVEMLLGIVRRIQDSGTAIILVEQSINVALTVADRAYFMEKGEVRFEGSTAELLERDDIVRSVFLEGAAKTNGNEKAAAPTTVAASARAAELAEKPVVLDVRAITKTFGGIRAVDDASFTLREGEILGLIGPNGAGKTTIFDLISGFLIPDSGRVLLGDIDVTKMSPDRRVASTRSLVPRRSTRTIADRRGEHRARVRAPSRRPRSRRGDARASRCRRARGTRGVVRQRSHRAHGPRRVPGQVRPRAVDR